MSPPKKEPETQPPPTATSTPPKTPKPPTPTKATNPASTNTSTTNSNESNKPASTAAAGRGRGRGRARGRGRRVVPRQVARRKAAPGDLPSLLQEGSRGGKSSARGARGRGRGDDRGRGRGRGASQFQQPTHASNEIGLGQIAPSNKSLGKGSRRSSGGGGASSAISSGAAGSSSYSIGVNPNQSMISDEALTAGTSALDTNTNDSDKLNNKKNDKNKNDAIVFQEYQEYHDDSEDDMPDDSFDMRNKDIAPYAGLLTDDGLLLPVSLPGLRSLPDKFREFSLDEHDSDNINNKDKLEDKQEDKQENNKDDEDIKPKLESQMKYETGINQGIGGGAKPEPMEIDQITPQNATEEKPDSLNPSMFDRNSAAHKILSSQDSLSFMQLPGLLPLNAATDKAEKQKAHQQKKASKSSVAEAVAASERLRSLAVDIRNVGEKGQSAPVGKLRFFKSGRVQLMMQNGTNVNIEPGITPKVNQQVVLVNSKEKTCEELENTVQTRLVAVPSFDDDDG